jgi:hypothetical protein
MFSGGSQEVYNQADLEADTRTFLYFEVFQDLSINHAFAFGKGIDAGYESGRLEPIIEELSKLVFYNF